MLLISLAFWPVADGAKMQDQPSEGLEHRPCRAESRLVTADHHGQRARLCGGRAAAHRRVNEGDAMVGGLPLQIGAGIGVDGRMDGDPASPPHRRDQNVAHLARVGIVHHTDADMVALRAQFLHGRRTFRVRVGERLERGRPARPKRDRKAGVDDPPGDRRALAAETDEPDFDAVVILSQIAHVTPRI